MIALKASGSGERSAGTSRRPRNARESQWTTPACARRSRSRMSSAGPSDPGLLLARFHVLLRLHAGQVAEPLKLRVRARAAAVNTGWSGCRSSGLRLLRCVCTTRFIGR